MSVGTTRLNGNAGATIGIQAFLAGDLAEARVPANVNPFGWTYGTGANSVNIVYADSITLTDGSNDTLDLLASGTLLDVFGRVLTMSAIKFLYIKNTSTDSGLLVGGGAVLDLLIFAATSDIVYVPSGGVFLWSCPSAAGVSTAVNKNLYLEDDASGAAGDKVIQVIAMGLD